jgi:hypothetical protein
MSQDNVAQRMAELMSVIDQALMLCDNEQDQLMLACAMLQRTTEIFDDVLGEEGRKKMFTGVVQ